MSESNNTSVWIRTVDQMPPEGVEVLAIDSGEHAQMLVYADGMWWFPDRSMYVYYVPVAWRIL
jgi:hypothetical protein